MRKLLLHRLLLASGREKTAKAVEFDPSMTVISGGNDMGKSSLIKSIFWCLGAEPAKWSKGWDNLDICAALTFSIDENAFTIVRHGRMFGIFDNNNRKVRTFTSVSKELGPYLADLVDFGLMLAPQNGSDPVVPPPAFYFLPSYIDQDKGWQETWSSFNNLGQFIKWKEDVATYHIGLYDNAYYPLNALLTTLKRDAEEPRRQASSLRRVMEQVRDKYAQLPVDFDVARYQRELDELVFSAREFAREEEQYRRNISIFENQRLFEAQKNLIAKRIMRELDADIEFALDEDQEVCCPTCGAIYQNSLVERFRLAWDSEYCRTVIADTQVKITEIDQSLTSLRSEMMNARYRHSKVWELLEAHQDALTLHQIIQCEAMGQAVSVIEAEVNSIHSRIVDFDMRIADVKDKLSKYTDKDHRRGVMDQFKNLLYRFSVQLDIAAPSVSNRVAFSIKETGSNLPRAVLCYVFAVLQMAWQSGQYVHPPIIIDSPKQQDQDGINYHAMLEFIKNNRPADSQMILGVVDTEGVELGGSTVTLNKKRQLLDKESYATVGKHLNDLLMAL